MKRGTQVCGVALFCLWGCEQTVPADPTVTGPKADEASASLLPPVSLDDVTRAALARATRPIPVYVTVPAQPDAPRFGPGPRHRTIYLNRHGGTYSRGWDNSSDNVSSIVDNTLTMPAWSYGESKWAQLVSCVQALYAPFNATVTDVDPGSAAHIEAIVSGSPSDIGMPDGVGGVSPFTGDCSVIERSITFNFAEVYAGDVQQICQTVGQETAHSFGLDHEFYCPDVMTYLQDCGNKTFRDIDARCGEWEERDCRCGLPKQNSVGLLKTVLGLPGTDNEPPSLNVLSPKDGATVAPGFVVESAAGDNQQISEVDLLIDGAMAGMDDAEPYRIITSASLAEGMHDLEVRAIDGSSNTTSVKLTVMVKNGAGGLSHPPGSLPAALGADCKANNDCFSGMCGDDGENQLCTEHCSASDEQACPDGFRCAGAGSAAVCWPKSNNSGGCAIAHATGGANTPLVYLALFALVITVRTANRRRGR